jgi:tRNA A37 threonylcarbamoyladenosine synthetase subunit TsaC/SUA5/YrdC
MLVPIWGGVPRVVDVLRAGGAVVVPLPSPLPYGVVATSSAMVNQAKGRPEGQPVGLAVGDFDEVASFLGVTRENLRLIEWMCTTRQLNVFAPLSEDAPSWMIQDPDRTGRSVGLMGSWLPELKGVLDTLGPLFISSANPSGTSPAVTAADADDVFGGRLLVVDGDSLRDTRRPHGSATIIRVSATGELVLARHGVNDESFAGTDDEFLSRLMGDYAQGADRTS